MTKPTLFITLRAKLSGAVYCNRPCLFVCLWFCLCVCGKVAGSRIKGKRKKGNGEKGNEQEAQLMLTNLRDAPSMLIY